jgi:hypothetical protein
MATRPLLKFWHVIERSLPFFQVAFTRRGFFSHEGRLLIWGKLRRFVISQSPSYAMKLREKYGIVGGCTSCGASCNLLFRCPHWDAKTHLCTVYEDRPNICKVFPITPADIRDRNITLKTKPCGFTSKLPKA